MPTPARSYRFLVVAVEPWEDGCAPIGAYDTFDEAKASLPLQEFKGKLDKPTKEPSEYQIIDLADMSIQAIFRWRTDMSVSPAVTSLKEGLSF